MRIDDGERREEDSRSGERRRVGRGLEQHAGVPLV
jgi:hypothetical protein